MRYILISAGLLSSTLLKAQVKQDSTKQEDIQEVMLVGKKPTIESKADRTVFNVANSSILTGNTTWDVLRMTPLVNIDNNDNVQAEGSSVTVYINDRKSVFTGKELKEYLKTIAADNLMKIEVITTPSAKYETSGAVINIVLKKNDNEGLKGSVSMNNSQSYKNSQSSSLNLNYHRKKFTQSFSGSFSNTNNVMKAYNENLIYADNSLTKITSETNSNWKSASASSSSEYELNDKNNIGLVMEYYESDLSSVSDARGDYFLNNILQKFYTKTVNGEGKNSFVGSNIFYKYYDKEKSKILDLNAGINYEGSDNTSIHSTLWSAAPFEGIKTIADNQNREYYLKLDYSQPIGKNGDQLEFGGKTNFRNNVMPYHYFNFQNNIWTADDSRINTFRYLENLNSVYANFSKTYFKKLETRIGLRYEYINFTVKQEVGSIERKDSYGTLMPDLLLKYSFNENYNLTATYKHSLWRPWYIEFNPFLMPTDNGTFRRGNMYLEPNPNDRFGLKLGLYKKYFISANYSTTNQDYWSSYAVEGDQTIIMPMTYYGRINNYSLYANTNQNFLKNKLNVNFNLGVSYVDNSDFKERNNFVGMKAHITNFSGSSNFSYTNLFNKNINLNGWVGLHSQNWGNSMGNKMNVFHSFGATKIFPKTQMEAGIRFNNIFQRPGNDITTYSPIGTFRSVNKWDWYGVNLSFVKRFGNQKVKENTKTNVEKDSGSAK
ncbi:outer membrane beta-barrel family protein [Kaistella sp.]|uniref:outer membrane beta-barrel family protein n=1 Tax=Kaistella sp. TaxID=2782235 RepID=UPI002F95D7E8